MEYIYGRTDFEYKKTCVTLGKFDGFHCGHQLLLSYLTQYEKQGYTSVVFTFDYHPENLFSEREIDLIYTEDEKEHILEQLGPDVLISYPFTKESASMLPEDFIKMILVQKLDAKVIVVGSDYRFGANRRGDVAMLKKYASVYGYEMIVCEKIMYKGQVISSTRIREEIQKGNIEAANEMLGMPYRIMGKVVPGKQIGRTINLPTVNLIPPSHKLLPPNGVYASMVLVEGKKYASVTNIGLKPTVTKEHQLTVETHIMDFYQDLYGKHIEVELFAFERAEQCFRSIEELKLQMNQDVLYARNFFKGKK